MEKRLWEFFGLLTIGIMVVIAVYYIVGFDQIIRSIAEMNLYYYLIVIGLIILSIFLWSMRWGLFVRKNNPEVTYLDLFKIQLVGQAMNNLTPIFKMGGEAGKLYLLKKKYEIEVKEGLASVSIDLTLELIIDIILVSTAVFLLILLTSPPIWIYLILIAFALVCSLLIFLIVEIYFDLKIIHKMISFFCKKIKKLNKYEDDIFERYETFRQNFRESFSDKRRFTQGLGLSFGRKGLTIMKYYVLLAAFGFNIGIANLIIAIGLGIILLIIPATPGNLGIYEGGMVSVWVFVGISPGVAATVIFLDRLIWFWGVIGVGSLIGSKYGIEMLSEQTSEKF